MSDSTTPAAAQEAADAAWGEHGDARAPLRAELLETLRNLEGVTGLQAGPGSERLADALLDFSEFHADELATARDARATAIKAEADRDAALESQPVEPAKVEPGMLETAEPLAIREWLKGANDTDVLTALNNVPNRENQLEWAQTLMGWGRADGNLAPVFAAINSVIAGANPIEIADGGVTGGTGATSSYSGRGAQQIPEEAAADDEPTAREDASEQVPVDGDADAVISWINHGADDTYDADRARRAFDAEQNRAGGQRPEVMSALVDVMGQAQQPKNDAAGNVDETAQSAGPLPLYEFVGPEGTAIDTGEWPVAAVHGAADQALYTHPETDVPGGPAMDIPPDSMWKVYDGDTTPFPGPTTAPGADASSDASTTAADDAAPDASATADAEASTGPDADPAAAGGDKS